MTVPLEPTLVSDACDRLSLSLSSSLPSPPFSPSLPSPPSSSLSSSSSMLSSSSSSVSPPYLADDEDEDEAGACVDIGMTKQADGDIVAVAEAV